MKSTNDVLTPTIDQKQIDAISKLVEQQQESSKLYNQDLIERKKSPYVWADIDFTLYFSGNQGFCRGWIHYQDGRKLYYLGHTTSAVGGPVKMRTIQRIPTEVLPFGQLVDMQGEFYASGEGINSGGQMTMTSLKRPISPFPYDMEGSAIISWQAKGVGTFTST